MVCCAARPGADASSFLIFFDKMPTYCSYSIVRVKQGIMFCMLQQLEQVGEVSPDCHCICCRQPLPGSWRASAARPWGATSAVTSFVPCARDMQELSCEVCRLNMWIGGYGDIVCKQFKLCYRLSRTTLHSSVWCGSCTSAS